jgi:hypothetical protein
MVTSHKQYHNQNTYNAATATVHSSAYRRVQPSYARGQQEKARKQAQVQTQQDGPTTRESEDNCRTRQAPWQDTTKQTHGKRNGLQSVLKVHQNGEYAFLTTYFDGGITTPDVAKLSGFAPSEKTKVVGCVGGETSVKVTAERLGKSVLLTLFEGASLESCRNSSPQRVGPQHQKHALPSCSFLFFLSFPNQFSVAL